MLTRAALDWECWDCAEVGEALELAAKSGDFCVFTARYFAESDGLTLCADVLRMPNCWGAVLVTSNMLPIKDAGPIRLLAKPYTTHQLTDCLEAVLGARHDSELAAHSMQRVKRLGPKAEPAALAPATAGLKRRKVGR